MCEDAVARLIAIKTSCTRRDVGMATGRPPLRPVALDAIAGDFDYEAQPMPAPAPLLSNVFDLAIVGAGIMGATAALRASEGGMRVVVIERDVAGAGASGVNAGTLSLQIKRVKLMPYALIGHEWWRSAGDAIGFKRTGGYTLAFNAREAEMLHDRMTQKRAAGAPIEFVTPRQVRDREPALCDRIVAASYCARTAIADSTRTGRTCAACCASRRRAARACAGHAHRTREGIRIAAGQRDDSSASACSSRRRWTAPLARCSTSRCRFASARIPSPSRSRAGARARGIGHATGLLTLKQRATAAISSAADGKARVAGSGRGRVVADTLLQNLRLARFAVPAAANVRVLRSWTGTKPTCRTIGRSPARCPACATPSYWLACAAATRSVRASGRSSPISSSDASPRCRCSTPRGQCRRRETPSRAPKCGSRRRTTSGTSRVSNLARSNAESGAEMSIGAHDTALAVAHGRGDRAAAGSTAPWLTA
jgi:glycine/D-amino acid oxidase-like deaminating enzyme